MRVDADGEHTATFAAAGFDQARNIAGGINAWMHAGLPVIRGKSSVIPLERQMQMIIGGMGSHWRGAYAFVHPYFLIIPAFIGCIFLGGSFRICPMAMLFWRVCHGIRVPVKSLSHHNGSRAFCIQTKWIVFDYNRRRSACQINL